MQDINSLLLSRRYDVNRTPQPDQVILRIGDKKTGSLHNLVTITGKQKNGKSRYMACIIAAAITGEPIFDISVKLPHGRGKIALFDTEQGEYDFYRQIDQVKRFSLADPLPPTFDAFTVREDNPIAILRLINHYLENTPECSLLLLDGILDCLLDFNNVSESKRLVNFFKKITKKYNCLMIGVLHRGKGNDTSIGNIGSMCDRFAQSVLKVEKNKDTGTFQLSSEFMRSDEDFEPVNIMWGRSGWVQAHGATPLPMPAVNSKKRPEDLPQYEHEENIQDIFRAGYYLNYDDLISQVKEAYGSGRNWAVECIKYLKDQGLIFKNIHGYTNKSQLKIKVK